MTIEEAKATFMEMAKNCAAETGATPEEIAELKSHEVPEMRGTKCLAACIYKGVGIIKGGKYSAEGLLNAGKMVYDEGSPQFEKIKEISMACDAEVSGSDECEVAASAIACELPKIKAAGFEIPAAMSEAETKALL
ncbi:general odorant-binding protein 19d-like [Ctenocephalides felis]|uniref:general odorant-binding protein 19d-like n=1 Tax=Ctenocephalides felis TaxID=7515 RepID=UPI000E6E32DB|nr:general odorant-binding protein 19d-like [Ctenocephalides felis]